MFESLCCSEHKSGGGVQLIVHITYIIVTMVIERAKVHPTVGTSGGGVADYHYYQ